MATADIIAAADHKQKPSLSDNGWGEHLLAGVYANAAPARDAAPPQRPVVTWWNNRALAAWERPILTDAAAAEWEREASVLNGVRAGER